MSTNPTRRRAARRTLPLALLLAAGTWTQEASGTRPGGLRCDGGRSTPEKGHTGDAGSSILVG